MAESGYGVPAYAYALNNPIKLVDSTGLDPFGGDALWEGMKAAENDPVQDSYIEEMQAGRAVGSIPTGVLFAITAGLGYAPSILLAMGSFSSRFSEIGSRCAASNPLTTYRFTNTVLSHAASRPYLTNQTVRWIVQGGTRTPDPQGVAGAWQYVIRGTLNGSAGRYILILHEQTQTVYHLQFQSL
ncbi:MAG: hypothetical protein HY828_10310 [Actinobacteria bacterium]|nr:hypothetical protein [Actinomycetota bacterium]